MTQGEVVAFEESSDKDWEFSHEIYGGGKRYDYALFSCIYHSKNCSKLFIIIVKTVIR